MKSITLALLLLPVLVFPGADAKSQESYPIHPDSQQRDGVPAGTIESFRFTDSKIYPGTEREYFVYVPAQYTPDQPAALMVFQDGRNYARRTGTWRLPNVLDNLIAAGDMPVTIAVCVNPGVVPGGPGNQDRFNRSFEYDSVSDRYARFLVEELLPQVQQKYSITDDPNLRGIAGSSSGAIAAFGVAWHRPDQFRRVFSTVGTYVGLRGGNEFPTLIRKVEPKPLRIFLQDGENDLDIYAGSWWNANLTMLSALRWAGYQVNHAWGTGGHNGKHGGSILPDAFRWLWKDFDQPIRVDYSQHPELKDRLVPGETWEKLSGGYQFTEGPALSPAGDLFFCDVKSGKIYQVADPESKSPEVSEFATVAGASGLMFDAAGSLYCAGSRERTIVRFDSQGNAETLVSGLAANDLVVIDSGVYFTCPPKKAVYFVPLAADGSAGQAVEIARGPVEPNGLVVTPDKRFLHVVDAGSRYVWSYRIEDDGALTGGQPYGYLHLPDDATRTGADGATMTVDGSLIVATAMGLQIFDQPGRVHVITSRPAGDGRLTNCVLGGSDQSTLFVTQGGTVYRRSTRMKGFAPWQASQQPPKPRL